MNIGILLLIGLIVFLMVTLVLYTLLKSTSQQDSDNFIITLPKNIFLAGEKNIYGPKSIKVYSGHFSSIKTLIATNKRVIIFGGIDSHGGLLSLWYKNILDNTNSRIILKTSFQNEIISIFLKDNPNLPIQIKLNEGKDLSNYINQQL